MEAGRLAEGLYSPRPGGVRIVGTKLDTVNSAIEALAKPLRLSALTENHIAKRCDGSVSLSSGAKELPGRLHDVDAAVVPSAFDRTRFQARHRERKKVAVVCTTVGAVLERF